MRKRGNLTISDPHLQALRVPHLPKYSRPKILLVDMEEETETILKAEGYHVSVGSFGTPYRVLKSDDFLPVIINGSLPPDFAEHEIVVVELSSGTLLNGPRGEKYTSLGEEDWWASCSNGRIDPRPRMMADARDSFGTILSHGGIFIVFADKCISQKLKAAKIQISRIHLLDQRSVSEYNRSPIPLSDFYLEDKAQLSYNNWSFLPLSNSIYLAIDPMVGQEFLPTGADSPLSQLLSDHLDGAQFSCTLSPRDAWAKVDKSWTTLVANKYGSPVGGTITPMTGKGLIVILPQIQDKARFLVKLLKNVLPDLCPYPFPHVEGARWVQQPEYELPKVLEFKSKIQQIQEEAKKRVIAFEEAIEKERTVFDYMHDLIRGTGRPLVGAVKKTLEVLGFQSVVDVDEEMEKAQDKRPKREDLRIHDESPILLVEVKGISGLPRDAAALQVWKYIAPRMREWGRIDIQGLAIINHQRNSPALDRENKAPFREDILTNAQEQEFGLLTTWDLFRLTRSYIKNCWKPEHIKTLFYQSGRIDPVPRHYEFVGVLEHFWERSGAVGVRIEAAEVRHGYRIAFELPVEFEEQAVESLQVDKHPVVQAEIGMLAGIETHLTKEQAKKGVRVFRLTTMI